MAGMNKGSVEIKIKTMEPQTYTMRVDKGVLVPILKEQIAQVTGVVSDCQHLLCRGKLLTDDKNLSAYHVEDGHTLHLVVRQPVSAYSVEDGHTLHLVVQQSPASDADSQMNVDVGKPKFESSTYRRGREDNELSGQQPEPKRQREERWRRANVY